MSILINDSISDEMRYYLWRVTYVDAALRSQPLLCFKCHRYHLWSSNVIKLCTDLPNKSDKLHTEFRLSLFIRCKVIAKVYVILDQPSYVLNIFKKSQLPLPYTNTVTLKNISIQLIYQIILNCKFNKHLRYLQRFNAFLLYKIKHITCAIHRWLCATSINASMR